MAKIIIDLYDDHEELDDASPIDGWQGSYLHPVRDLFGAQVAGGRHYWPMESVSHFEVVDDPEPERKGASASGGIIDEAFAYLNGVTRRLPGAMDIDTTPLREVGPEERYAELDISRITGPTAGHTTRVPGLTEQPNSTNTVGVVTSASSEPVAVPMAEWVTSTYHTSHQCGAHPETCIYCLDDARRAPGGGCEGCPA